MSLIPKWYKPVVSIALIWNILGTLAIAADMMITPDDLARLTPEQQALYASRTWWSTAASMIAVLGGTAGSLGLLLRKTWAEQLLIASVAGLIVQDIGLFIVADGISAAGPAGMIIQFMVFVIALSLVALARRATSQGWITSGDHQSS